MLQNCVVINDNIFAVNPNVSLQHRKGNTMKKNSTVPYSPNLRSHLRSRPVHIMTKEEEEEKEADEMRT